MFDTNGAPKALTRLSTAEICCPGPSMLCISQQVVVFGMSVAQLPALLALGLVCV